MYCQNCGHQILSDTRFCPSCGTAIPRPESPRATYSPPVSRPVLLRPRTGRMVAGVCAAFARTYGWNVTLIRILLVVLTPFHLGLGFLAYVIAWVVIPEDPYLLATAPPHSSAPPPPPPPTPL